ncbi:MAG: MarR family winged helix-turn-helix transcriptional regulator [Erysipelotrichaceae bacterium]|nr:MarR family winged helix-turn-helix transcriptional regulator [Erysipelotrichaceae bacterium]
MSKRIDNTSCHCLKMRRSAGNVVQFYDSFLAPSGVTVRQYSLLNQIGQHEGCSMRVLSEATDLDRSTLTRSLKPLFQAGLIEDRKAASTRNSMLFLSEKGKNTCEEADQLWGKAQSTFEQKIGKDNVEILENMLTLLQDL